jgi:septum formation protein
VDFEVRPSGVEELSEGDPEFVALENARRKAAAVDGAGVPVLGADTLVCLNGVIYGKPGDVAEARETLLALSGETHEVISGIALDDRTAVARTAVTFGDVAPWLDWYLASNEWRERAGGYAIQGRGAVFVKRIEGDYFNVVGLPIPELLALLRSR